MAKQNVKKTLSDFIPVLNEDYVKRDNALKSDYTTKTDNLDTKITTALNKTTSIKFTFDDNTTLTLQVVNK